MSGGATSIYFNGRLIYTPGSYSEVDASALEAVGLGASGYVVAIGTAVGGTPYNALDPDDIPGTIQKSTRPGQAKKLFISGELLESEGPAFAPSNNADIEGGAQRLYYMKVNQSTKSATSRALGNGQNSDVDINGVAGDFLADKKAILDEINAKSALITAAITGTNMVLTSEEYGYHTTRINWQQGAGSTAGYMLTITYETTSEVLDNVGGTAIFTLKFTAPGIPSYSTCIATVSLTELVCEFTVTQAGLSTDFPGNVIVVGYGDEHQVELSSDNPADTFDVIIYGIDGSQVAVQETITLTGAVVVTTVNDYNAICAVRALAAPTGTVTVRNVGVGPVICTLTTANQTRGWVDLEGCIVNSTTLAAAMSVATLERAVVVGLSSAAVPVAQIEKVANGDTTTGTWSELVGLALGELTVPRTLTLTGVAWRYTHAAYPTVTAMADKVNNAHSDWLMSVTTGVTTFAMTDMDYSLAGGAPANTVIRAVYLVGGNEGSAVVGQEGIPTATIADWQAAIDLLKRLYCNTLVPLTHDPSVHAYLKAHIAYMCGVGRQERDGAVGLKNTAGTGLPTKTEIKTQIIALGTRHLRAVAQQTELYNSAGVKTKMDPHFLAMQFAGMQAGTPVGTSLTFKSLNNLGIYGDSSWSPVDDSDEMIQLGLAFAETVDGVGRRIVRNITTYLLSVNLAYSEASVNEAANYCTYNLRTELEGAVGENGFQNTEQGVDGRARKMLDVQMGLSITNWRSLSVILAADVNEVSVEVAPVLPNNFIKTTVHLYIAPSA